MQFFSQRSNTITQLTNLERRHVQAELVKPIYDELVKDIGKPRARALLARAVGASVQAEAGKAALATGGGADSMTAFSQNFLRTYESRGATAGLDVTIIRSDEKYLDFDVTRCRFVEMYNELGLGEIADVLSCNRDGQFATAFDPNISLDRAKTIAAGAACCTFRYTYNHSGKE
jgi:hypothetical protein